MIKSMFRYKQQFFHILAANLNSFKVVFLKVFNDYANRQHIEELRFQSYVIKNPLGVRRLMVAETFINFMSLMDFTTRSVVQESEINSIFQILFL